MTLGRGLLGGDGPGYDDTPTLKDRVWVGPGAVIAGALELDRGQRRSGDLLEDQLQRGDPEQRDAAQLAQDGSAADQGGDNFPDAAIYISESGGDARVPFDLVGSPTIDIAHNLIEDNYNGVTLWENADRYCGSPSNTSTGYCTLVNPSVAKISTCTAKNIDKEPYYSDCRWKTQNVKVHHNSFKMDRGNFFNCAENMCGRNAIFSNYGSSPSWSPYKSDVICKAITFSQGNVFSNNTYTGTWNFTTHDASGLVSWSRWRTAPFGQDGGSALTG